MTTTSPAPLTRSSTSEELREVRTLFAALESAGIGYCHWKSNEHLGASLRGLTDLDVLVDRRAAPALARVLAGTSFRQLLSLAHRGYPGVESYVGMDPATGTLLHLHLHFQLTLGERYLKGYRLPWEDVLLSTRVRDAASGVYVADPSIELLLLLVRAGLKVRIRDGLRRRGIGEDQSREFAWLAQRVDADRLAALSRDLLGEEATRLVLAMTAGGPPTLAEVRRLVRSAEPPLDEYRTYSAMTARGLRWYREIRQRAGERLRRAGILVPTRRLVPSGGVIVVFIGVDGSGKSTLARDIARWLGGLLDVVPIYLGSGVGPGSTARRLLELIAAAARRAGRPSPPQASTGPRRGRGTSLVRDVGEMLWVWALSRERERKAAKARRARNRGMIVICDRFPQSRVPGNDGPALAHWMQHRSPIRRHVARLEQAALRRVERLEPDLVVKLDVPAEVSMQRKPDTPVTLVRSKLQALEALDELGTIRIVTVDATRSYEEVLLEAKHLVWDRLGHG